MNKECPWWHKLFHRFDGERYSRVRSQLPGSKWRITEWKHLFFCRMCRKPFEVDKMGSSNDQA